MPKPPAAPAGHDPRRSRLKASFRLAPWVALGLFNVSWAIFQVVGSIGGAELSRVGVAVPFLLLMALFAAGARATSRLSAPLAADRAEPELGSR